jgi:hypothetical protein
LVGLGPGKYSFWAVNERRRVTQMLSPDATFADSSQRILVRLEESRVEVFEPPTDEIEATGTDFVSIFQLVQSPSVVKLISWQWTTENAVRVRIELTSDRPRSVHAHVVLLAVAKALEHCHGNSVVIGNLKLSDVRWNSANEPVLTGFNRAIVWQQGMQIPDPELVDFAAPEFWLKNSFGPEADIWSFGILMWELVTHSRMLIEVARKLQQGRRPPALQSPYWTLMARCWTVVPTARPTAGRVVAMLAGMKELMDDDAVTYLKRFQEAA